MPPQGASNLRSQGIEYADCMRSHGVPKYPDPTTTGRISRVNLNTPGLNPSSALFQAAESTCSKLLPKGAPGEQQSSDVSERAGLLAISRCMRRHGVSGFPDPTKGAPPSNPSGEVAAGGGVFMAVPSTIDTNSPAFKQAATAVSVLTPYIDQRPSSHGPRPQPSLARGQQGTAEHAEPALLVCRRSDRRRNAEGSAEAIVSSDYRQRMKAPAPAVGGPLLDHAYSGREALAAALLGDR